MLTYRNLQCRACNGYKYIYFYWLIYNLPIAKKGLGWYTIKYKNNESKTQSTHCKIKMMGNVIVNVNVTWLIKRKRDRQLLEQERSLFFWNRMKFWSTGQPSNACSKAGCFPLGASLSDCAFQSHGCKMLAAPPCHDCVPGREQRQKQKAMWAHQQNFRVWNSLPRSHT